MIIGVPTEIKNNEERVALVPHGVKTLTRAGNEILIQRDAGLGSDISNEAFQKAGATMVKNAEEVWRKAEMILKVKEPLKQEFNFFKYLENKTLFTYLHLSGVDPRLTQALLKHKVTALAYETVENKKGGLPLLEPMSEIAGIIGVQEGAHYLMRQFKGRGVTLGEVGGIESAHVVIVGGGTVGVKSAGTALGMGSRVTILEKNPKRINYLRQTLGRTFSKVSVVISNEKNLKKYTRDADLLIGAVLVKGSAAPHIITREMIENMHVGSVVVDIAIDQGGCTELSKPTTHSKPIFYSENGVIFYCVTNMPAQASLQATYALTAATLPYVLHITKKGLSDALKNDAGFMKGLNTHGGYITYRSVARDLGMQKHFRDPIEFLE